MLYKLIILIILFLTLGVAYPLFAQGDPTPSQDSIRDKVKEKVENARSNPKAYIGSVTDKTQDSIQIKNAKGEILFVSINPDEVKFVKSGNSTTNIKFADVAIGDYVIAMGYKNSAPSGSTESSVGSGVLTAKRIVVTIQSPATRRILVGNIQKIDKKDISVLDSNGQQFTFSFPKSWKGPEIKDLTVNDKVIIVAIEEDGKEMIRTIDFVKSNTSNPQ